MSDIDALSALYEASRRLGLEDDLDSLLDEVLERAMALIGFDCGALLLGEPESGDLVVRKAVGFDKDVLGLRLEAGRGICGWVVEHQRALREGDVSTNPLYVPGLAEARSALAVPLILENQLIGVINVESHQPDAFTEEHEMLLTILGTKAALAIVASRTQQDLRKQIALLDALYRISTLSASTKDFDEVLDDVLSETQRSLPRGVLAILWLDEGERHLVLRHRGGYVEGIDRTPIPLDRGIAGRCARTGRAQIVDDVRLDPDYIQGVDGARSQLTVPLVVEGTVIGVLIAESVQPAAYSPGDLHFATVIAAEIAGVLRAARLKERAARLAITDPLTGLFNRRHFRARMADSLRAAMRYGEELALLLFDLDHFKAINDTYGHLVGDDVLSAVAACLSDAARAGDIVARIGGEEFAILLHKSGSSDALAAGRRMQTRLRQLRLDVETGESVRVSASLGISLFPEHGTTFSTIFGAADTALYRAKSQGRDQIVLAGTDSRAESSGLPGAIRVEEADRSSSPC